MKKIKPKQTNIVITLEAMRKYKQTLLFFENYYKELEFSVITENQEAIDRYREMYLEEKKKLHDMEVEMFGGSIVTIGDYDYLALNGRGWPDDAI
ncbi:hypothetical protein AAK706_11460 [Erysipelotrichaceae bacterium 66-17]